MCSKLSAGSIVRDALEQRLRMIVPFIGQWPQVSSTVLLHRC